LGGYGLGGYGYGGYVLATPMSSYNWGSYVAPSYGIPSMPFSTPTTTRSMYYSPNSVSDSNRATIRVHLPADAILYVDGKLTSSSSNMRQFVSPPLDADKDYHYSMKATVNRDGETLTTTRRVDVRAGRTEEVYLNFPGLDRTNERDRAPADSTPKRNNPDQP
jgi:uncharacterized protein (TIGR03000 family)